MSDISPDAELWQVTLNHLSAVCPKLDEIIHGTDDNSHYLREELKELPLYAVRGIYSVEQEDLDALIHQLNRMRNGL